MRPSPTGARTAKDSRRPPNSQDDTNFPKKSLEHLERYKRTYNEPAVPVPFFRESPLCLHVSTSPKSDQPIHRRPPKREIALYGSTACTFDLTDYLLHRDGLLLDKFDRITGSGSCTDELRRTLNHLDRINLRLDRLRKSTSSLLDASVTDHEDLVREISEKVDYFEDYNAEGFPVGDLSNRLKGEKEKVKKYDDRLKLIRRKIDSQKDVELESRRVSSRMC